WMQFMEKFLKDKPNDKFPKPPAPDREIVAKRAEAQRKIVKAQADEAETKALTSDETSDKAKDAAQEDESPKEPGARPVPKMVEPDGGLPPRMETGKPPRPGRDERQRPGFEPFPPVRPPSGRPFDPSNSGKDDKKKRGKNGNPF
ncbi:MAG TPA: hypothetical protein VJZ26_08600, partial [Blastocatellia bacterium]|nr:hypothetical protein [Blastocatellia bacterium]